MHRVLLRAKPFDCEEEAIDAVLQHRVRAGPFFVRFATRLFSHVLHRTPNGAVFRCPFIQGRRQIRSAGSPQEKCGHRW